MGYLYFKNTVGGVSEVMAVVSLKLGTFRLQG